ncbi:hypothetical protein GGG16DRAFT_64669 [Schizophyllum commune]
MSLDTITIPQLAFTGFAVFATASFCTSATIEGFFFTFLVASLLFPGVYLIAKAEREHAIASTPSPSVGHDTEDDHATGRAANDDPRDERRDDLVGDVPHQRDIEQPRHDRAPSQRVRFVEHFGASDPREEHSSSTRGEQHIPSARRTTQSATESRYSQESPERPERQDLLGLQLQERPNLLQQDRPNLGQQDHPDLQRQLNRERRTVEALQQQLAARDQELAARDREIVRLQIQLIAERGRNAPVIPPPPPAPNGAYGRPQRFSGRINQASDDLVSALELCAPCATEKGTAGAQMSTKAAPEGQPHRIAHFTREDGASSASWGRVSNISVLPRAGTNEPSIPAFAGRTQRSETHSQYGHISTLASAQCAIAGPVSALTGRAPQQEGRPGWFDASTPDQSKRLEIQRDANVSDEQQAARGRSQEQPPRPRAAARQDAERCFREALEDVRPRERHDYQAQGLARVPQDGLELRDAQPLVGPSLRTNPTTLPTTAPPSVAPPYPPRPPRPPQPVQRPMVINQFIDSRVHIPSLQPVDTTSVVHSDSPVPPPYLSRLPPSSATVALPPPADVAARAPASMPPPAGRGLARNAVHDSSSCVANGAGLGTFVGPTARGQACELPPGFVPTSFIPFSEVVNGARGEVAAHDTERDGGGKRSRTGAPVAGPSAIASVPDPISIPSVNGIVSPAPAGSDHDAQSDLIASKVPASTMSKYCANATRCARNVGEGTSGRAETASSANALRDPSAYRSGGALSPFWLTVEWALNRTISVRFDSSIGRQGQSNLYIHDEAALDGAASTFSELLGSAWDPYPGEEDKRPAMLVRANIQSLAPVDAFLRILVARSVFSTRLWRKIRIQMPEVPMERPGHGQFDTPTNLDTLSFSSTTIIYSGAPENVPYPWSSIIGLSNHQVRKLDIRCAITQEECMAIAGSDAECMNGRVLRWVPLQLRLVRVISGRDTAGRRATFFSRLQSLHVLQSNPILAEFRDRLLEEGKRCMQNHVEFLVD